MNKDEFITYIAIQNKCTKVEGERIIDTFTKSVISAIGEGKEISLIGFGNFSVSNVAAREGHNPQTGKPIKIEAFKQVRFKVGKKLKDAVNNRGESKSPKSSTRQSKKQTNKL